MPISLDFDLICDPGYFAKPDRDGEYRHRFCGSHSIEGAICPSCEKPFMHILTVDARDPRLGLNDWPHELIPLLWCWPCQAYTESVPFSYKVEASDRIRVLVCDFAKEPRPDRILTYDELVEIVGSDEEDEAEDDDESDSDREFPYENYPDRFPESGLRLRKIELGLQSEFRALHLGGGDAFSAFMGKTDDLFFNEHQIGGTPYVWFGFQHVCPICEERLVMLASIKDHNLDPRGFVKNPGVYLLYALCMRCRVVVAESQAD
ncbi:MAG: hypothetical protein U0R49_00130 [Fimbriimonadales bacterium]